MELSESAVLKGIVDRRKRERERETVLQHSAGIDPTERGRSKRGKEGGGREDGLAKVIAYIPG